MAINFDRFTDGGDNGGTTSSKSWSHVSTGSNLLGLVGILGDDITFPGVSDITSVTWNSVPCTLAYQTSANVSGLNRWFYLYYIIGPDAGSQPVAVTAGSTHYLLCGSVTYSGVKRTGFPDAITTNQTLLASDTTLTTSMATVGDDVWAVVLANNFTGTPSGGVHATLRGANATFGTPSWYDSNGIITPPQVFSMTTNTTSDSTGITHIMFSFATFQAVHAHGIVQLVPQGRKSMVIP